MFDVSQETVVAEAESAGLGAEGGLGAGEAACAADRGGRQADRGRGSDRGSGRYHTGGVTTWSVSHGWVENVVSITRVG